MHTDISRLKYLTFKTFCIILFPTEETKTNYSPITQLGIYLYVYGSLRQVYIMKLLHRCYRRYKKKGIDQRRYFWKKSLIILCVLNIQNGTSSKNDKISLQTTLWIEKSNHSCHLENIFKILSHQLFKMAWCQKD